MMLLVVGKGFTKNLCIEQERGEIQMYMNFQNRMNFARNQGECVADTLQVATHIPFIFYFENTFLHFCTTRSLLDKPTPSESS